jgi:hypothetical protein
MASGFRDLFERRAMTTFLIPITCYLSQNSFH